MAGHEAFSCDIQPSEDGGPHLQGDARHAIRSWSWDVMIAHPPCTSLAVSGAAHFWRKAEEQREALDFVAELMGANIGRIAIENPVSIISSVLGKPSQVIQPWQFGHGETKATCLWLKNLPLLQPEHIVSGREQRIHKMGPGPNRARERSRTYTGIAAATVRQWGALEPVEGRSLVLC